MPVEKTRNSGEWTEARYNSFVKGLIRAGLQRWGPRHAVVKRAWLKRGWYRCEECLEEVPSTLPPPEGKKRRIKNIVADHIDPIIDPAVGFQSWSEVVDRAFVEIEGFQAICHACHTTKTKVERDIATARKRREKDEDL